MTCFTKFGIALRQLIYAERSNASQMTISALGDEVERHVRLIAQEEIAKARQEMKQ